MTRWIWTGMAVAAMLLMAPAASATSASTIETMFEEVRPESFRLELAPDAALFNVRFAFEGSAASELRYALDNLDGIGDGDGTVTKEEVSTFQFTAATAINSALPTDIPMSPLTIDGTEPRNPDGGKPIELAYIELNDAEGDVDATGLITATIELQIWFADVDKDLTSHDVSLENIFMDFKVYDASEADNLPTKVTIGGYRSWDVIKDTVDPVEAQERYTDGALVFTASDYHYVDEEGESLTFEIQGDPSDAAGVEKDSPGFGLASLLAALGVAVLVMRRR